MNKKNKHLLFQNNERKGFIIAGPGTNVGKTLVSAILTVLFNGSYWKPIECGRGKNSDTTMIKQWLDPLYSIFSPAYSLKHPLSPHHAARLERISIDLESISLPQTDSPLIIESAGGICTPLTLKTLNLHMLKRWQFPWVIVSRHYLGSINHTLLTLEILKQNHLPLWGILFNGKPHPDTENVILDHSQLPFLGRLLPENHFNLKIFKKYAKQWQPQFIPFL